MSVNERNVSALKNVNFYVKAGEILGVCGVEKEQQFLWFSLSWMKSWKYLIELWLCTTEKLWGLLNNQKQLEMD